MIGLHLNCGVEVALGLCLWEVKGYFFFQTWLNGFAWVRISASTHFDT
jgi:hypothetical protein